MSLIELIMARDLTRYFFHIVYHVIVTVIENIFRLFGKIEIQFWKTLGYLYIGFENIFIEGVGLAKYSFNKKANFAYRINELYFSNILFI